MRIINFSTLVENPSEKGILKCGDGAAATAVDPRDYDTSTSSLCVYGPLTSSCTNIFVREARVYCVCFGEII